MNIKIKICYVISSLARGGPVNVLYNIIKFMDPVMYDISIITLVPEGEANRVDEFKKLPLRILTVYSRGPFKSLNLYLNLKRAIKHEHPDLIHSHCPRSLFLLGVMPINIKQAFTVHIYPGIQQIVMYGQIMGRAVIILSKYFIKKMDMPIACAENVSEALLRNDHISVKAIPNCGSYLPTKINDNEKQKLRDKLGLRNDLMYFICIGRLSKEKNPEFLVKAFKNLNLPNIGFIILGSGALKEAIEEHHYPGLVIPGFVENVSEYILASDYYVSASLTEGLANTLLETMALGLPFILSDIPPHYEVYYKSSEFMGVIFKNNDENYFQEKLQQLITYPYKEASNAVRACFTAYYTPEKMSYAYQKSYNELVAL